MNDPRAAIHEFAAILAGENREAYSVEFARYYQSQALYAGMSGASYTAVRLGLLLRVSAAVVWLLAVLQWARWRHVLVPGKPLLRRHVWRLLPTGQPVSGIRVRHISHRRDSAADSAVAATAVRPRRPPHAGDAESNRTAHAASRRRAESDDRGRDGAAGVAAVSRARIDHGRGPGPAYGPQRTSRRCAKRDRGSSPPGDSGHDDASSAERRQLGR